MTRVRTVCPVDTTARVMLCRCSRSAWCVPLTVFSSWHRRLDELDRMVASQRRAFDAGEMSANALRASTSGGGSASAVSKHRFGSASAMSDLDARIAAAKADLAARAQREADAKENFREMEKSIAASEDHLVNAEVMSVRTLE